MIDMYPETTKKMLQNKLEIKKLQCNKNLFKRTLILN